MEALDLLKKDWHRDKHEPMQVSENQIYGMLHKKSSSIVKWILIVCIAEFLITSILSFCFNDNNLFEKIENNSNKVILIFLNVVGYVGILYFLIQFYKNYKRISTTATVKKLIFDILKTQKTVKQYVWFNVIFGFIISFVVVFDFLGKDRNFSVLMEKASKADHLILFYIVSIVTILLLIAILLFFVWLYYKILYGFLLKRLHKNHEELKKLDF